MCRQKRNDILTTGGMEHKVYIALGSNLGNRKRMMREAIDMIGVLAGKVDRVSSQYETEPWGFSSPNMFLNMCIRVLTPLSPDRLLAVTQEIERRLGRVGKSTDDGCYHDRVIDIDILLYDDEHISTPQLTVPHPLMHERDFVMKPLREILDD